MTPHTLPRRAFLASGTVPFTLSAGLGALGALSAVGLGGCASPSGQQAAPAGPPPASVVAALAPTGSLRACINLGNAVLARREADGQPAGVSVDLARALAAELGVPVQLVVVTAAAASVQTVRSGAAEIGFFAVDPARSDGIRFSAPYVIIEGAYLVRQGSPLTDNAQVDRPGTKVMVGRGSAYDLFLTRHLQQAQRVFATTSQDVVPRMLAEGADVAAGVKQQLEADAARLGGLRLLPGRFMVIEQAMGVNASRGDEAARWLHGFVERAKASGAVAAALRRHGVQGALVAPAAPATGG
jgi:polar amino acid transport system substrate-binding protein